MLFVFLGIIAVSFIVMVGFVLLNNPSKNSSYSNTAYLSNAENTNSYQKADNRYRILENAGIKGTYLKKRKVENEKQ